MSILMQALEAANISAAITNETAWTILAPNNAAFETTLAALNLTAQELLANQVRLVVCLIPCCEYVDDAVRLAHLCLERADSIRICDGRESPAAAMHGDVACQTHPAATCMFWQNSLQYTSIATCIAHSALRTVHCSSLLTLPDASALPPGMCGT
jgi:hypothetical protein